MLKQCDLLISMETSILSNLHIGFTPSRRHYRFLTILCFSNRMNQLSIYFVMVQYCDFFSLFLGRRFITFNKKNRNAEHTPNHIIRINLLILNSLTIFSGTNTEVFFEFVFQYQILVMCISNNCR